MDKGFQPTFSDVEAPMKFYWPLAFVAVVFSSSTQAHPADHEESLRSLLSLEVDKLSVDEVKLQLTRVRVSTEKDRTVLSWRVKDEIYTYVLSGAQHETRANSFLSLLGKGQLTTVVIEKEPYRTEKFAAFRRVLAFQWVVRPGD